MEKIELKIPNLGEAESTEIIEVNIEPGKEVSLNDPLIVLESEKAAMEIPSDFQGQIKEVLIKEGDEVSEGMVFAIMEAVKEETHTEKVNAPKNEKTTTEKTINETRPASYSLKGINAGPAVRKYARELEIDLQKITPSAACMLAQSQQANTPINIPDETRAWSRLLHCFPKSNRHIVILGRRCRSSMVSGGLVLN